MENDAVGPGRSGGDVVVVEEVGPLATAAASVWTDYPRTPRWYYPGFGCAAALVVLAVGGTIEHSSSFLLLLPVAAALFVALFVWYLHAWGNWPSSAWPTAGSVAAGTPSTRPAGRQRSRSWRPSTPSSATKVLGRRVQV